MAERTLALCPGATASWCDGVGHVPFWEAPDRFDHELAGLARNAAFMTTSTTPAGQCDRPMFVLARQACDPLHVMWGGADEPSGRCGTPRR
jgi:hypothetical protein